MVGEGHSESPVCTILLKREFFDSCVLGQKGFKRCSQRIFLAFCWSSFSRCNHSEGGRGRIDPIKFLKAAQNCLYFGQKIDSIRFPANCHGERDIFSSLKTGN